MQRTICFLFLLVNLKQIVPSKFPNGMSCREQNHFVFSKFPSPQFSQLRCKICSFSREACMRSKTFCKADIVHCTKRTVQFFDQKPGIYAWFLLSDISQKSTSIYKQKNRDFFQSCPSGHCLLYYRNRRKLF